MKVRADIADMLRAGIPHTTIARQLNISDKTVSATRVALGLPAPQLGGRRSPLVPLAEAFAARTAPVPGGHLRWTGYHTEGRPILRRQGKPLTAQRIAWSLHHTRPPVGPVRAGCGYRGCVAPAHMEDREMRDQLKSQMTSIFGGAA
ncbi:hypothetical protein CP967_08485 [Streptomyces nitrosporeus]|uniref:Uncharacterized protein n=1 Tax=Streptomyces nitrosporeus TaxID=28894 RepID=A0A5J6FAL6_9ACTN|nr:hypothetical protein [Streptomyces nitrosporeus]QEU72000.1 hypothetical protein CP967_08485 [Streptomyces nitrosporeus]GGY81374.1 hypothetical protein GCM10010327_10050 [Streptomyces nitrosporeus]